MARFCESIRRVSANHQLKGGWSPCAFLHLKLFWRFDAFLLGCAKQALQWCFRRRIYKEKYLLDHFKRFNNFSTYLTTVTVLSCPMR